MDKEKVKQIVLDIISEIAPDEDLNDVKPDIRLAQAALSTPPQARRQICVLEIRPAA